MAQTSKSKKENWEHKGINKEGIIVIEKEHDYLGTFCSFSLLLACSFLSITPTLMRKERSTNLTMSQFVHGLPSAEKGPTHVHPQPDNGLQPLAGFHQQHPAMPALGAALVPSSACVY